MVERGTKIKIKQKIKDFNHVMGILVEWKKFVLQHIKSFQWHFFPFPFPVSADDMHDLSIIKLTDLTPNCVNNPIQLW